MSADLESRIAAGIRQLAGAAEPAKPPVDELLGRRAEVVTVPVSRGWPWRAALGAAAAVAALAAGLAVAVRDGGDEPSPVGPPITMPTTTANTSATSPATSLAVPPDTSVPPTDALPQPRVAGEALVPDGGARLLAAFGALWIAGTTDHVLQAIDPTTMRVRASASLADDITSIAADDASLFTCGAAAVARVDPASLQVEARSDERCAASGWGDLAVGFGSLWVPTRAGVQRLDPRSLQEQSMIDLGDVAVEGVAVGDDAIWITAHEDPAAEPNTFSGLVIRVDPVTGEEIARVTTPGYARQAIAVGGWIWVTLEPRPQHDLIGLIAIDPASNSIVRRTTQFPVDAGRIVFTGSALVVSSHFGPLAVVDPTDGSVTITFDPAAGDPPRERTPIAWDGSRLWNLVPAGGGVGGRLLAIDLAPVGPAPAQPSLDGSARSPAERAGLAAAAGRVWRLTADGSLAELDPEQGIVERHDVPAGLTELVAGDGVLFGCGSGGSARIDLTSFTVTASAETCERGIAVGEGSVWLAQGATVARLDQVTMATQRVVDVGQAHGGLTVAFGAVWVADGNTFGTSGFVTRIDPSGNRDAVRVAVPSAAHAVVEHAGQVWVTLWPDVTSDRTALAWIDPDVDEVVGTMSHLMLAAERILPIGGQLVVSTVAGSLAVLDPSARRLVTTWYHGDAVGQVDQSTIAWDGTRLWQHIPTSGANPARTLAIDLGAYGPSQPASQGSDPRTVSRISVATGDAGLAVGAGRIWLAGTNRSELAAIDPATSEPTATLPLPAGTSRVAADDEAVFVCGPAGVQRVDPTTVVVTATDEQRCDAMAAGGDVWTLDAAAGLVRRLDRSTLQVVATIEVPNNGRAIAAVEGRVLVAGPDLAVERPDQASGSIVTIDAATNQVVSTTPVSAWIRSVAVSGASTWISGLQMSGGEPIGSLLARVDGPATTLIKASVGLDYAEVIAFGQNVGGSWRRRRADGDRCAQRPGNAVGRRGLPANGGHQRPADPGGGAGHCLGWRIAVEPGALGCRCGARGDRPGIDPRRACRVRAAAGGIHRVHERAGAPRGWLRQGVAGGHA